MPTGAVRTGGKQALLADPGDTAQRPFADAVADFERTVVAVARSASGNPSVTVDVADRTLSARSAEGVRLAI